MSRFKVSELDGRNVGAVIGFDDGAERVFGLVENISRNRESGMTKLSLSGDEEVLLEPAVEVEIFLGSEAKFLMHINNVMQDLMDEVEALHTEVAKRPVQQEIRIEMPEAAGVLA